MDLVEGFSDGLLVRLNGLGFALTGRVSDAGCALSLTRFALGHHLNLTLEKMGPERWLVGLESRLSGVPVGREPEPAVSFPLRRFGTSPDGVRLELSKADLENELPRLLENVILPLADSAPHDG